MKKLILGLFIMVTVIGSFNGFIKPKEVHAESVPIYYLASPYCSSCEKANIFLNEHVDLKETIIYLNTMDPENKEKIAELQAQADLDELITPTFIRQDDALIGFNASVQAQLFEWSGIEGKTTDPLDTIDTTKTSGLVFMTVILGSVDGVNPCSVWALLFLMTMMVARKYTKKQLFVIGHVYILTLTIVYGLFVLGVSLVTGNVLANIYLRLAVFFMASMIGIANILTSFHITLPFTFSIQPQHKKRYIQLAGKVFKNKHTVFQLSTTAVIVGLFASLIELPCTAGFPILWNGYMKEAGVIDGEYFVYLLLYLVMYVLIEWVLLMGIVLSMKKILLSEKAGLALKLGSGVLMVGLGIAFLFGDIFVRETYLLVVMALLAVLTGWLYYKWYSKNKGV